MEISTYRDNVRDKTIFKIEVDGDINDFEKARELMFAEVWDGLHKYRAIEQKLGIPLEVLFKALKEGIWVRNKEYVYDGYHIEVVLIGDNYNQFLLQDFNYDVWELKDYGKAWALTREELPNERKD